MPGSGIVLVCGLKTIPGMAQVSLYTLFETSSGAQALNVSTFSLPSFGAVGILASLLSRVIQGLYSPSHMLSIISQDLYVRNHSVLLDGEFFFLITENFLPDPRRPEYRIMKGLFGMTFSTTLYAIIILLHDNFANTLHQIYILYIHRTK